SSVHARRGNAVGPPPLHARGAGRRIVASSVHRGRRLLATPLRPVTHEAAKMGVAGTRYPQTAGYGDRRMPPAQTVERMRPHMLSFGITRLARQTGLDRIGIPCWAAFRPNALTLSNSQGKGLDDMSASASALMEAVEFSIAETAAIPVER